MTERRIARGPNAFENAHSRRRQNRWVVLAVLGLALGSASVFVRFWPSSPKDYTRNDFTQDYVSAREWRDGRDPYQPLSDLIPRQLGPRASLYDVGLTQPNPHVPAQIVLMSPLSFLPYRVARAMWLILGCGALALGLALMARHLGLSRWQATAVGVGAMAVPVAQAYVELIQFEGVIVVLLVLAWLALKEGKDRRAGIALGIAAGLKLYPGLMLIPLLRMRRRQSAGLLIVTAVTINIVGVLIFGISNGLHFLHEGSPANYRFWRGSPLNLSLPAIAFRWLTTNAWRPGGINVPQLAAILALAALLFGLVSAAVTPARRSQDIYWATVPWMLLASPLSWEFSLILALPVVMLLAKRTWERSAWIPISTLIPLTLLLVGLPPNLQGAVPNMNNGLKMLPYMVPTIAILIVALSEWRELPLREPASQPSR